MKKRRYSPIWTFLALLILALFLIFVVYPLILILYKSVVNPADNSFTLENFNRFFTRKYYTNTLKNSFSVTIVSTLISATLGLVIAYITRQYKIAGSKWLNICIVVSYLSPPFIGAYAWIQLLGRNGLFTRLINNLFGLSFGGIYGFAGIVLVFSLQSFPLVYMYVSGALQNLDNSLNEAAESLGANNFQRVTGIILPLVLPTVLASSLLVFMRVFSDFGTPMLIGEGYRTFPVVLYNQFMGEVTNDSYFAAALCVIIMAITLVFFFLQRYIAAKHSYAMSALKPMLPRAQRMAPKILCHVFVYLVVLIALLPQLTVIVTSFLRESTPGIFTTEVSLINYTTIFSKNPLVIPNTYLFGLAAIALVVIFGVLISYLAVRRKSIITSTVDTLTMLPYIIPGSVLGICFLYAFAKPPLALTGTAAIIIISLTVRRMPYTIRSSTAIISQISPSIEEAAVSLGASEMRSFGEIMLPMMMPGVISGAIMSWVTVISELSSSIMLYRASTQTLTVAVYTEVIRDCFGNAAAYSTVLTVTSVLSLLLFFKLTGRRDISV
ncbi:MAG: iron ABC transporter permease [Clostridia bacterium]|nr:iron ABC transporter permease [Clostridia bacterium]